MKSVKQNLNIKKLMEDYQVAGLSIAEIDGGHIKSTDCFGVLENGTDKQVESDSIFSACSISKFLTSILVMKLTEQGILDLDEDVNEKLSSWRVPYNELNGNKKVTLRNLLSHQSGIIDPEGSFTELNLIIGNPSIVELLKGTTPYCKDPIEIKYEPETDFHYSDAGFCIIQQLIEDVMRKPFQDVMNELIFQPLHMKESTYKLPISEEEKKNVSCGHDKRGDVVDERYPIYPYPAASGLWTTPSDLASLVIELMSSLRGESNLNLSRKKALEVMTPQGCKEWTGLGAFLDKNDKGIEISSLGWGVGFQCLLVAYPYLKSGLVIMTNTDLGVHQLKGIIGDIYKAYLSEELT
ncbi:penicillin-binding protein [Fictibacillus phosphorivorans]|uniref:Penicillin-binding protein n=1 Tax=Fictibacillus phosphorivorans TaxID=1221500 RepID=A0A160IML8_9BACL|nr:serine hydrolase domain-containing protein [Fictibacillus phosphorivorans]ANC77461.1 penicillin-binding protein [Fictibacillus phosphorivorans]